MAKQKKIAKRKEKPAARPLADNLGLMYLLRSGWTIRVGVRSGDVTDHQYVELVPPAGHEDADQPHGSWGLGRLEDAMLLVPELATQALTHLEGLARARAGQQAMLASSYREMRDQCKVRR